MQIVPLQAVPSQVLSVPLNGQAVQLAVYQKAYGLFIDVYVNDALIIAGVICENLNRIVRDAYLGFVGDLSFTDTQGRTDPVYTDLGDRYQLLYIFPEELPQED